MIDNLTILFNIKHTPFGKPVSYSDDNDSEKKAYKRKVQVRNYNTSLNVHSKQNGQQIEVSGNFVKFLQGHNIFGSNDLQGLCRDVISEVAKRLDIIISKADWIEILKGYYEVMGVDVAGNYRVFSREEVPMIIRGIELHWRDQGLNVSNYGSQTVYLDQHNKNVALKFYDKRAELRKHPLPNDLPERLRLLKYTRPLVRAELTLGAAELRRRGLDKGANWSAQLAKELLLDEVAASGLGGEIKRVLLPVEYDELPHLLKLTYRLWLHGDDVKELFDIQKYRRHRNALQNYRIDISKPQPKHRVKMVDIKTCISPENVATFPRFAKKHGLIHIPVK